MRISLKNAVLVISDGAAGSVTVNIGDGTFRFTEAFTMNYELNRGTLDDVTEGDDIPMEVNFDFVWDYLIGTAGSPSVREALRGTGNASAWKSTDADTCNAYAVDLTLTFTPDCDGNKETMTFSDFRVERMDADIGNKQIAASGKCNVTQPTAVRASQS